MKDDGGRIAWLWGPILLVAVLVVVFQFSDPGGAGPESRERRGSPSSALPAGPGASVAGPMPGGDARAPDGRTAPLPGYPAAPHTAVPAPYPGGFAYPPWAHWWPPHSFPRPGDHSGRYWGSGAAEWGPPIGEYGPDTEVDPYWWVAAEEADR